MNKRSIKLLIIMLILFILAACGNDEQNNQNLTVSTNETGESEEVATNTVRITISIDDGAQFINEQEVKVEEGANLLEVLAETFFIETDEDNNLTSIERVQTDEEENTSWELFVNDEKTDTPAKDYNLNGGEIIIFDLQ